MTEEQGYQIIALLEKILSRLPDTGCNIDDIYSELTSITTGVGEVQSAVKKVESAVERIELG